MPEPSKPKGKRIHYVFPLDVHRAAVTSAAWRGVTLFQFLIDAILHESAKDVREAENHTKRG